jgi:hypothetical protein
VTTEELPVEECDHRGPGWCVGCRAPRDDDEPLPSGPTAYSTRLRSVDVQIL